MGFDSTKTVRDFVTLIRGTTYKGDLVGKHGPALLGLGSIQPGGGFRETDYKTYGGDCPDKLMLTPGDLFASLKGATKDGKMIGSVARVPPSVKSGRLTQDTVKLEFLQPSKEIVNYLYWLLRTPQYREYCAGRAMGSAVVAMSREDFLSYEVPPFNSLRSRIVELLEEIEQRERLLRETNATLEAMAQALFKSWFVDFDPVHANAGTRAATLPADLQALFPSTFTDTPQGPVPEGWSFGAIKNACKKVESGGTPKRNVPEYWGGDVPWLSSGEVRNPIVLDTKETITQLGVAESSAKLWPAGSTIVAMYGATAGEVCLLASPSTANQACCGLTPKDSARAFVFFCIRRERENLAAKSSGSAQQNLNKGLVESHEVILPSDVVLSAFEDSIGTLLDSWIENEKQAQTLATLRGTLLPRLISGQLRLPDAEAALAEVGA